VYEGGLLRAARSAEMGLPLTPDQPTMKGARLEKEEYAKREKGPGTEGDLLTEFLREKARILLQVAVEAEMEEFLHRYEGVVTLEGKRVVVRNGHNPERTIQTGIGEVSVNMPKVRDRSGQGIVFHSSLVPPYLRKTGSLQELIPLLYLKGVSTGQMQEALEALVGRGAKGFPGLGEPTEEEMEQRIRRVPEAAH